MMPGVARAVHEPRPGGDHGRLTVDAPPGLDRHKEDGNDNKKASVEDEADSTPKVTVKEADTMKLGPLPEAPRLTLWKQSVRDKVVSASGRGEAAFAWILEAENFEIPDDSLEARGPFESMDAKLSSALNDILRGRIATIIMDAKEKAALKGKRISGRLVYRMVLKEYNLDRCKGHMYDLEAFRLLNFPGDERLEQFLDTWEETINGLYRNYPDEDLEQHLFSLIKRSSKLAPAINRYKLAEHGDPERSYKFLHRALSQHVKMEREDRIAQAIADDRSRRISAARPKTTLPAQESDSHAQGSGDKTNKEAEAITTTSPAAPAAKKQQYCFNYREGKCTRGKACPYAHDRVYTPEELQNLKAKRSKTPCKLHAQGKCKFGSQCQFLHGETTSSAAACTQVVPDASALNGHFNDNEAQDLEMAVPASQLDENKVSEWLLDTGTENHLISKEFCHDEETYKADRPLRLATANGVIRAETMVDRQIDSLGTRAEALVLDKTVNALSVGRLVKEKLYSFHWPAGEDAYLVDQTGNKTVCDTKGFVPILRETLGDNGEHHVCLPCEDGPQGGDDDEGATKEERLRKEATSPTHLLCHFPKNPFCWICGLSDITMSPARRVSPAGSQVEATSFGEHVCLDHIVLMRDSTYGLHGERAALLIVDMFTRFTVCVPVPDKSADETFKALRYFLGDHVATKVYSDNSKEIATAASRLVKETGFHAFHQTATPHRPQSNSLVERAIRTLLRGARGALVQAGLPHRFWPWAVRHQAFAQSISDRKGDGTSSWSLVHGEDFAGWVLPFGSLVFYRPPRPATKNLPKFAPRGVPGIFVGWHMEPGCGFRGDYFVIPLASFKDPNKREYRAHRIKELVSFDATKFPFQQTGYEELVQIQTSVFDGPDLEVKEVVEDDFDEDAIDTTSGNIDTRFQDVMGYPPADHLTHEEKMLVIEGELFGDNDYGDGWGNFGAGNIEDISGDEAVDEEGIEDEAVEEADQAVKEADQPENHGSGEQDADETEAADGQRPPEPLDTQDTNDEDLPAVRKIRWNLRSSARSSAPCAAAASSWTSDPTAHKDRVYLGMVAKSSEPGVPAPSRKITPISDRRLVEFCCSENSVLGHKRYVLAGCQCVRLTIHNDLTTQRGLSDALAAVRDAGPGEYVHLWASLPCTGGSPWQYINQKHPGAQEKIRGHLQLFIKLIRNFKIVAREVLARHGDISFEWPTGCALWKTPEIQDMIEEFALNTVNFHGCAAGLASKDGVPIKKPWTVATNCPAVSNALSSFICPGKNVHPVHAPCAGTETKKTELYTKAMADAVHNAIREEALSYRARHAMAAIPEMESEFEESYQDLSDSTDPNGHRPKLGPEGLWCTMITKTLAPSDPLCRSPPAIASVDKELANLREIPTWDEQNPREAAEIAAEDPLAHFARVFPIIGIKHFEDLESRIFKGRIVLSGDKIKTATGSWAVFQELGTVPATMTACRIILSVCALIEDAMILQSDCTAAYTQAEMTGPATYIRLPKAWWPRSWAGKFKDPVCRLLRALYGHPRSGDIWGDKLEAELLRLGFRRVDSWPSVFVLHSHGEKINIVFVVYVDDLVMVGCKRLICIIKELRKTINMDEPAALQKYLGCVHEITHTFNNGERLTKVVFNMTNYMQSALDQYAEVARAALTKADSPYAPRLADEEIDKLLSEPGDLAPHAASLIMKLMYAARMACPHVATIVSKMSSRITRWTREDDRRLHRVYCYLNSHQKATLQGSLSTADASSFWIGAWPDADYCGDMYHARSTSGYFLTVETRSGRSFPLSWGSKKQGGTARSTPEAELISLDKCLATELLPAQQLMQEVMRMPVRGVLYEDNAACIAAINKGYSPELRHLKRQHKVSISHLHEIVADSTRDEQDGRVSLEKARSEDHKGDVFTKELEVQKFQRALSLIGVVEADQ